MLQMNPNASLDAGSSYYIASLDRLENSAANLASYNQQITNNARSLAYIVNSVRENWENENGQDIESILANLNDAIRVLSEDIQPVISTYVETLNRIVTETRLNQGKTL